MARGHSTRIRPPRRSVRTWVRSNFNLTFHIIDGWNDLTRRMEPPDGVLQRFTRMHPEVRADQVALVWEAFLDWVRIRGRQEVPLCQPSLAVDDLWRQIADDGTAWRQLPEQVQAMGRIPVRDHRSRSALAGTLEQAYWDEFAARLPLLFQVDEFLAIDDARLYRGECTVEDCKDRSSQGMDPEPGRTCLHGIPWVPAINVGGAAP